MKGLFIPGITAEMFRNGCLESVETLMAEGEIYDVEYSKWIPVSEGLPKKSGNYWCTFGGTNLTGKDYYTTESDAKETFDEPEKYAGWRSQNVVAWMPLPEPYKAESEAEK